MVSGPERCARRVTPKGDRVPFDEALKVFYDNLGRTDWQRRIYWHPTGDQRRRHILKLLGPHVTGGSRLLDVGCGDGEISEELVGRCHVYGIDIAEGHVVRARARGIRAAVGSAVSAPFAHASFDLLICSEVIEHFEDPGLPLREAWGLLRPEGLAILSVPLQSRPRWTLRDVPLEELRSLPYRRIRRKFGVVDTHLSFFDQTAFLDLLARNAFHVLEIRHTYASALRRGFGLPYRLILRGLSPLLSRRECHLLASLNRFVYRPTGKVHHVVALVRKRWRAEAP